MKNYAVHDVGAYKVEIRRIGRRIEFRPLYSANPTNAEAVYVNAELRFQGGAWAPVPSHLLDEAIKALDTGNHA